MRQLIYTLRFTGHAAPTGDASSILRATMSAPSCTITTVAGPDGVSGNLAPSAGGETICEAELAFVGETTFHESGTITFGEGVHRLRFSTVAQGHLSHSADPRLRHGTAMWQIDGGEGQFAGAWGRITSNFVLSPTGVLTDHHVGVIYIA